MIGGVHTILYSKQPDLVRAFLREVLEFSFVDAGHGWLIFAAPPSELAVHPSEERRYPELYLLCRDVRAEVARLESKGVEFTEPIKEQRWGLVTKLRLPDGETLGLYEPKHTMAIEMASATVARKSSSPKKRSTARTAKHRKKRSS